MSEVRRERNKDYSNEGLIVHKKAMEEGKRQEVESRKKENPSH